MQKTINTLREEKRLKEIEIRDRLDEINGYTTRITDLIAENRVLRQMNNVPDNFGIDIESIKLRDKDKVEDYKKLIQVLQNDNYSLEKERAELKHKNRLQ